jgi:hypothetical protein
MMKRTLGREAASGGSPARAGRNAEPKPAIPKQIMHVEESNAARSNVTIFDLLR